MPRPSLHDPEAKKAIEARLARAEGQVRGVRRMIGEDQSCEDIALQLAAARKALDRVFYEMVSCMIRAERSGGVRPPRTSSKAASSRMSLRSSIIV